ncbi:MAG: hypothetical protein CO030_02330 [Candidatus Magasanikbacteria bacterium CG_4_9_14_0_2_um_filter_42_11]|uniref:tRNA uridine(34) hydroxylase n=1 Tax=Candidatus Magasanikbacteria bacterium CG_4_9_14_0_2_um_filter_42_11 TaxID=1974643 RepID=A0A2M8F9Z2_9BACT|nr:MAG: hypothetical protein COU34_03795 [Candidatus Magasanikbacteria bacterium CG10_big_fil_rev_8_21_14_0_10_43_9]PJC52537.1 MAG: hypothetical protein CO030_02330 [Candidatus Magasanikbacteria bacterium CG_4_9_14_0_2_um_filter_42_11]
MYQTLLYYKIVSIKYPESEQKKHLEVCKALQLKGRILMSKDGINGNIGGTPESVRLYRSYMDAHDTFKKIDFKQHDSEIMPFPKLSIKVRDEIITTEARDDIDWSNRGRYVDRDTFHEWLKAGEEMVIIDMRNDYEWAIGHFKDAVKPPVKYFREIKNTMEYYEQFKEKKIVMYCTGGIRCEPATALFVKYGFDKKNVYHLEGGIVKYAEKYGDEGFFEGKCFTFDDRIAIVVNTSDTAVVLGNCEHCGLNTDEYRNCLNKHCNKLFIGCDECIENMDNTCKKECQDIIKDAAHMRSPRANTKVLHRNK